jgi:hypothetical protein
VLAMLEEINHKLEVISSKNAWNYRD